MLFFFITVESLSIESCLIWLCIPRAQHISWHITVTKQLLDEWMKDRKSMKKILILEMIAFAESIQWWEVIVSKLISSRKTVKTNIKQNQQRPPNPKNICWLNINICWIDYAKQIWHKSMLFVVWKKHGLDFVVLWARWRFHFLDTIFRELSLESKSGNRNVNVPLIRLKDCL